MAKEVLLKVDKNGTEWWGDYTCDHCGGLGGADAWAYTGWTCYKCGGKGLLDKPNIWKKYTPEYKAKLDARREAREAKKRAEDIAKSEELNKAFLAQQGFSADGFWYVVLGNTYNIKDELKQAGARYTQDIGWHFDHETNYPTVKIHIDEYYYKDCVNTYHWNFVAYGDVVNATIKKIKDANCSDANADTSFFGAVGDKVELKLTYTKSVEFDTHFGYRDSTSFFHSFVDDAGHTFIWKTSLPIWDKKYKQIPTGTALVVKGAIKEHSTFNGIKQTVLTRCKYEEA